MKTKTSWHRRRFFAGSAAAGLGLSVAPVMQHLLTARPDGRRALFDGRTLQGWHARPRLAVPKEADFTGIPPDMLTAAVTQWYADRKQQDKIHHTGHWEVVDGAIIGGQDPAASLLGAYLVSDQTFADFELELEARPDWPADTGIMIRAHDLGSMGFQVLVDHRPGGCIGGIYGNSIGSFLATPFAMTGDKLPGMRTGNLRAVPEEGGVTHIRPDSAASLEDFLKTWRVNDWNRFRIRCVGRLPVITTWINDTKICELDTAKIEAPGYDAETVARQLGRAGHIALEVHDVSMKHPLGRDRWGEGARCRWRNITITEL